MFARFAASLLLGMVLVAVPALAQAQTSPAAPAGQTKQAKVEGFRNARFGMNEEELRKAIAKDFNLTGDAVQKVEDPSERTTALLIKVKDLLPDSGVGVVAYIMGYKSKKLFRVNVIWGREAGSDTKAENIVAAANALRNFLTDQGYKPDTLVLNHPLDGDNVLVFQGKDNQGRLTELVLSLITEKADKPNAQPVVKGANLRLSYVEKPTAPDIYRIDGGF
ncbi:hypothetical protein GE253_19265 [Niveispirillum sp. SYP-B3756]|uniref:hypothetical protein n=1 Tax=Niveispirillum sp. SYP-B3756 TaxID=2662178 RepID=UPI0012915DD4|nr:hypothetical protein [Niveispirillum sp. SYP-B3756]MQP67471.1 hypothetical protein [Niveispirillum sp. SYP-B3756]